MSEECTFDCSSCGADCPSRGQQPQPQKSSPESFLEAPNEMSHIKKVIAIMSGKGGVGKSLVTSLLSVEMARRANNVAIMDADITGPSIPRSFGITERASGCDEGMFPVKTKTGISIMSMNLTSWIPVSMFRASSIIPSLIYPFDMESHMAQK